MARANPEDTAGDLLEGDDTEEDGQEENIRSDFFGENRYNGFQPRVGNPKVNNEWQTQRRKRRRHDTSSVDAEAFSHMSNDEKMLVLFNKLSLVEAKQNSLSAVMPPVHEKIDVLENCVDIHDRKIKMLSYRSLDLEARSRRNNLVFRGLADIQNEDCKKVIVTFIQEELETDISVDDIARAHRLGSLTRAKARYAITRRPIIVNFKDYSLTEQIMEATRRLSGTMFRVERDFPAEISEARRRLWPTFKSEKVKHPTARVVMGFPAKVIKNGRVVRDEFPDWNDLLRVSRVRGFESGESSDEEGEKMDYYDRSSRQPKPAFGPWQPWQQSGGVADADGSTYYTPNTDTGSDTSARPSQGARKKVYIKSKQRGNRRRQSLKMTERVAENMRNSKNNIARNKIPVGMQNHRSLFQRKTENQNNRSSTVPDSTRGGTKINTGQGSCDRNQPMDVQPARDTTQSSRDETVKDTGVAANSQ